MTKKGTPWWSIPAMIGAGVAGLTALGGVAINYATYAEMPKKVVAVEQKNVAQDAALDDQGDDLDDLKDWAKEIQSYTKQMQQQVANQAAPAPEPWEFIKEDGDFQIFRDPDGILKCCDGTTCIEKPKKGHCPS